MLVFVYGTLKSGGRLHTILREFGVEKVSDGTLMGHTLYLVGTDEVRGFPAMVPSPGDQVEGEVWTSTPQLIRYLDQVEGHPSWYRRTPVVLEDGTETVAYIWQGVLQHWGQPLQPLGSVFDTSRWAAYVAQFTTEVH